MADEMGGGETGGDDTAADRMGTKETGADQTPSVPPASIPSPASHSEALAMSQGDSAAAMEEEKNSQPEAPPVIVSTVSMSASQLPTPPFASHSEASAVAQGDSAAAKEEEKNSQPEAPPVTVSTFPLSAFPLPIPPPASAVVQADSRAAEEEEENPQVTPPTLNSPPQSPLAVLPPVSLPESPSATHAHQLFEEIPDMVAEEVQGDSRAAKEEEENPQVTLNSPPQCPLAVIPSVSLPESPSATHAHQLFEEIPDMVEEEVQGDSRAAEEEEENPQVTPPTLNSPLQSPLAVLSPVSLPESPSATHAHQLFEEIPDIVAEEVPLTRPAVEFPLNRSAVEGPVITPGEGKGLVNIVTMDVDKVCSLTQNVCSLKRASEEYIVELGSRAETMMGEMESMGVGRDIVQSEATRLLRSLNCFARELRAFRIRALLDKVILKVKDHCPNAVDNEEGIEENLEQSLLPQRDGPSPGGQWEEHVFLEPWEAKFWSVACLLAIVMIVTGIIFYYLP